MRRRRLLAASILLLLAGLGIAASLASRPAPAVAPTRSGVPRFVETVDVARFQKGNLHTHTLRSDGDSDPGRLVDWYQRHGYAFLAITDHNLFGDAALAPRARLTLIPGEEVTMKTLRGPVHVNALCHQRTIGGHFAFTAGDALHWAEIQIREQDGVMLVNHPNYHWMLRAEHLDVLEGPALFEIQSGHPRVHWAGDADHPSAESIWDAALARGHALTPVAVDDAHRFKPKRGKKLRAGLGWVQVFADEPDEASICDALRHGRLYASSGPEIERILVSDATFTVWPADTGVTVDFIGREGRVLQSDRVLGVEGAHYRLRSLEGYVRARVTDRRHRSAWTAAYQVTSGKPTSN